MKVLDDELKHQVMHWAAYYVSGGGSGDGGDGSSGSSGSSFSTIDSLFC